MHFWATWYIKAHYIGLLLFFVTIFFVIINKLKLKINIPVFIGSVLLIVSGMIGLDKNNYIGLLGPVFLVLPCCMIFSIDNIECHEQTFNFIVNFFYYLLPISLFVYILSYTQTLPSIGIINPQNEKYSDYINYGVFIYNDYYKYRFNAVFLEPGHLGMILSYLLYSLKFNLKDMRVRVLLLSLLLTLSLAGLILSAIGYFFCKSFDHEINLKKIYILVSCLIIIIIGSGVYNNGDNLINNKIVSRLQYDKEKGISGNNRLYGITQAYFNMLIKSDDKWWGVGVSNYLKLMKEKTFGGAGWKVYIIQRGIISLFLVIIGYIFYARGFNGWDKYTLAFLILYFLSFLQRAYPLWASWLLPFFFAIKLKNRSSFHEKNQSLKIVW
jgi:hypothetical protein